MTSRQFEIKAPGGAIHRYTIRPLSVEKAFDVSDLYFPAVAQAYSSVMGSIGSSADPMQANVFSLASGGLATLRSALKHEQRRQLAVDLLTNAVVESGDGKPILRGEVCIVEFKTANLIWEFYREHPLEIYEAIIRAIDANWPGVFTEARAKIADFVRRAAGKK